jgi:hypothetical protein
MWRIVLLGLLVSVIAILMIFRVRYLLKFLAMVLYSKVSPMGMSGNLPLWARYYLSSDDYEGPPPGIGQLEETVRIVGYTLVAIPLTLVVMVLFFGSG